ncbi:MAG: VTT domain-containing protein [Desulfobulbaceae bacterium]|nr:VTT domain-containing protein [Desulfobulbaceae bacterium]
MRKKNKSDATPVITKMTIVWFLIIVCAVFLASIFFSANPAGLAAKYLSSDTNSFVFAGLMAVLPLAGFPISIFLVLVGMVYGITGGILLTGVVMLFHMIMTYYLVHSLFRPLINRMMQKFDVEIPQLPGKDKKGLAFLFMIAPGLPYSVKNYLLALTELPFLQYLLIAWLAQFGFSIPFIVLGKSMVEKNLLVLLLVVLVLLAGYLLLWRLQRRFAILRVLFGRERRDS